MKLTQDEQTELMSIKDDVQKMLNENEKLKRLYVRKQQIINYLTLMTNTKENKDLIEEYNKLDVQLRGFEVEAGYIIAKEEQANTVVKKSILGKKKRIERYDDDKYNDRFNEILKETEYSQIVKKRNKCFKELTELNNGYSYLLYELDSIETEISIIETDTLRKKLLEND